VTELGRSLADLPMPLGPIVTGMLPVVAIACLLGAAYAYWRSRRVTAIVLAVVGVAAAVGAAAFYTYVSGTV
jgi:hypothetical protein